jgi:type II secretory pathway component GspD/PulD (secretin)
LSLTSSFTSSLFIEVFDRSLSYLGTETSIKSDEVKLNLRLKSLLLQTYKIIHDRLLSYLGTETSIKSDEVKLDVRLKSPLLQTYKIIHEHSLSYLGTETSIKSGCNYCIYNEIVRSQEADSMKTSAIRTNCTLSKPLDTKR